MIVPEMSANEAITLAEEAAQTGIPPVPQEAAPLMAAMLLTVTEIANGTCPCTGCSNIREIAMRVLDAD